MSKRDGCRQSCCRVPFDGVCGRQQNCACHQDFIREQQQSAWATDADLARAANIGTGRKPR